MWIAYLDESAEDERQYMSVAALLCPVTSVGSVVAALDKVVADTAAKFGTAKDAEIHVQDLLGRTNGWEQLPDIDSAVAVMEGVVESLNSILGVNYVMRGVDVVAQKARQYPNVWSPRRVGIQHVLEKCNEAVREPDSLLVVVDEMAKPDEHRRLLDLYRESGTPGFRNSKLRSVVDNIYFMPSHCARGLQAADVLAYIHRHFLTMNDQTDERAKEVSRRLWGKLMESGKVRSYGKWPN